MFWKIHRWAHVLYGICQEDEVTEKDSVFVKGSAVIRQDDIKYHEVSDRHKRAIEKKLAQTTPVALQSNCHL
jgi:hypothetical protein